MKQKCPTCHCTTFSGVGTKEAQVKYYLDRAMRLGACLGQWTEDQNGIINSLANRALELIRDGIAQEIMSAKDEEIPPAP